MRIYVGFDDTDTVDSDRGTGKLARWFENELPESCRLWGVVRQQLLLDPSIPYTTHNSSACTVVECSNSLATNELISRAVHHMERHYISGSDPGLSVVSEDNPSLVKLIDFGRACTSRVVTQKEALQAAEGSHLSGHGGSNDGIIGAAAGVGLTAQGWGGRFIEFGRLRDFPERVRVSDLERSGIAVVSIDRDARFPAFDDLIDTKGWLRPRLWGGRPVLPVIPGIDNLWETVEERKRKTREKGGR
ncbi:MAG TPA: hypothetical protein VLZ10_12145 [Thermodesulfobacteriota bacterium]|nr:hypothetical protein [Thermodesulfobacteriota bacterium]